MKSLVDDIYSKLPDVTIVLSTLVKSRDYRACAEDVSKQFRNLVKNEYRGKRMGLADIDSVIQMSQLNSGGIHPTDDGYKLFAGVWWNAIDRRRIISIDTFGERVGRVSSIFDNDS